jgi:hypothetical protein
MPDDIKVTLTSYEQQQAAVTGMTRQIAAIAAGKRDKAGFKSDPWGAHIESASSELAVAKYLNVFWDSTVDTYQDENLGDVQGLEVRWTKYSTGKLSVHSRDYANKPYVLVVGGIPDYYIKGWMTAGEAQEIGILQNPDKSPSQHYWFVEQSQLHSMDELDQFNGSRQRTLRSSRNGKSSKF